MSAAAIICALEALPPLASMYAFLTTVPDRYIFLSIGKAWSKKASFSRMPLRMGWFS